MKKQTYMMANLGLFYLIIIALFAVPLVGTFVVVLIKGVLDFKYAIMFGGAMALIIAVYYLIRLVIRMFRKIRENGMAANQEVRRKMRRGEPVEISVFNGLMTFSYGGKRQGNMLSYDENETMMLLPHMPEKQSHAANMIDKLSALSELREQGIIDEAEFQKLKTNLMADDESLSDGD